MNNSTKFLIFILVLFFIGILTIKKNYFDYKSMKDYHTISGFYSSLACVITSLVLFLLYVTGNIPFKN